jgi:hypothetical protein
MRRVIGQATGGAGRLLHRLMRVGLVLCVVAALALVALAWRLGQGPLALPWLTRELVAAVNDQIAPLRLSIAEASLVWEGFTQGVDRPLDIRASDVALHDGEGRRIALVPRIDLSVSLRMLVTGNIAARGLSIEGTQLRLERREDGTLSLQYDQAAHEPAAEPTAAPDLTWLFTALAEPPGTDLGPRGTLVSQLRRLRLHDTVITVNDRRLGLVWRVSRADADLRRGPSGGLQGTADLAIEIAGRTLAVDARLALPPAPQGSTARPLLAFDATLPTIVPSDFAGIAPPFAPLAAARLPVGLTATGKLGPDLWPTEARLQARLEAGTLHLGPGRLPVTSGLVTLEGHADAVVLTLTRLALPAATSATPVLVTGEARLQRGPSFISGTVELHLDEVAFADLPALWPDGVGGPGAKPWITSNITGGTARNLSIALGLHGLPDLSDISVASMTGSVDGRGMVVHWLRPVPPVEAVDARLTFVNPDQIDIAVTTGRQGAVAVTGGSVTLTGLSRKDQYANITVDLAGPVADVITLLNHPRINLLSRRPIPMRNPAGKVEGRLAVLALPLENDLSLDDVRLSASGRLTGLQIGAIAAGHDLTDGTLAFDVTNDGLRLDGTATLAAIPSQLRVEMDFTEGPPTQVIQKIEVSGTATAAQLASLGLATDELAIQGQAALKAELTGRRNGRTDIAIQAELDRMALAAARLNWSKPEGRPARASATILLERDRITTIDRIRIDGDGITVQAALDMAGRTPRRLRLARARLAPTTDVQGEITWPQGNSPWILRLNGPSLDVSGFLKDRGRVTDVPPDPARGPPWQADARLDRVVLGPQRHLDALSVRIDNDGLISRTARITGRAGAGNFDLSITPANTPGATRRMTGTVHDAGALIRALDLRDDILGGRLTVDATYNDNAPGHPLAGTIDMTDFGIQNAPALAKLLQALSVYGVVEALSGRDMRFQRLILPFRYVRDLIEVNEARTYNASLGMTAKGRIDLARRHIDLEGTVVPAYALNSFLGRIPVIGRLLSPERGGGLIAMTYGIRGPIDDPSVRVNPLSAVTPGFLRGLFGVFEGSPIPPGGQPNHTEPGRGQQ